MKAKAFKKELAVVVPVAALRTKKSCGTGEFSDLVEFAQWCKKVKISLIQILPVHDTGYDNSPYNLVSAFALHPLYISLERLDGADAIQPEIAALRKKFDSLDRLAYREVLTEKLRLLKRLFKNREASFNQELADTHSAVSQWIEKNDWIKSYAVYKNLKEQNFQSRWQDWQAMRTPTKNELEIAWNCPPLQSELHFYTWLQFNLYTQLLEAVQAVNTLGIMLEGDVPILLNEDSCDVWANGELFRYDLTAGAAPDGQNPHGQNWGFPSYFWQNHKETGYRWWKERLQKTDEYCNAFRIDHILGFFRLWAIPRGETTACLGRTVPYTPITHAELLQHGFSAERIRWMSEPHIDTQRVMAVNDNDYLNSHGELHKVANRIGEEELWLFKPEIKCETDLTKHNLKKPVETVLREKWLDRMLIKISEKAPGKVLYTIACNFQSTTAWSSLSTEEQKNFLTLYDTKNAESEKSGEAQGREILSELLGSVSMQAFAEDLGAIPPYVPKVLEELNIFSLNVVRWKREWNTPAQPFTPLAQYKALSVTTPAIHDTSTLTQWWNEELSLDERRSFLKAIQLDEPEIADKDSEPASTALILQALYRSPSRVVAFQIQDMLALIADRLPPSSDRRINTPGTVNEENWTYRMPEQIERLTADKKFIALVKSIRG